MTSAVEMCCFSSSQVNYLKSNNFGGAFVWSVDLDDKTGTYCKMGENPFIGHLHNLLVPGNLKHLHRILSGLDVRLFQQLCLGISIAKVTCPIYKM